MAKKVGQGIFTRSEPWERYYTEKDGYIYYISEEKNFTADKGWKIMKHEGGNEWVYILTKKKIGYRKYEGEKAYRIYKKLLAKRRRNYDEVLSKGYDTYAVRKKNDVLCYSFSFERQRQEHGKSWDKDIEKTRLAVYYEEEYVSDYFATFRECLKYAEEKLLSDKGEST